VRAPAAQAPDGIDAERLPQTSNNSSPVPGISPAAAAKKRGPAPKLQQQMERIQHLPRAQQRFVMQVIDTVLARQDR
jgi:hypothetical protein